MAAVHGLPDLTRVMWLYSCVRWWSNQWAGVDLAFSLFSVYFDDTAYINWINRNTVQIKSLFKYNICHLFLVNFITNLGYQLIYYITWCETKTCKICKTETDFKKIYTYQNLKKLIKLICRLRLCGLRVVSREKREGKLNPHAHDE